jgi:nucleoside-diphosphate-sugar epimerase
LIQDSPFADKDDYVSERLGVGGAGNPAHLLGAANTNNRAGHRRIAQSPRDGNLALEISIAELACEISTMTGFIGHIAWDTTKPNGQPRRGLDVSRAEREFGFRAATPFDVGLRKTIEWYQSHRLQSRHTSAS